MVSRPLVSAVTTLSCRLKDTEIRPLGGVRFYDPDICGSLNIRQITMQITLETFKRCIAELQDLSNELNDTWIIHKTDVNDDSATYLTKKQFITSKNFDGDSPKTDVNDDSATYLTKKQFITSKNFDGDSTIPVEYHVVYSISYATPILCLNSWRSNGTLLTMLY
ncbi:Autophagocytosis associated protein, active-site domain [Popillia japonica]|uniref:Autophagocytosis associated protein, active-site domain n=1 Tax=Popillia japonica TaxID=7064 RepID=A0AAW1HU08_POPJA